MKKVVLNVESTKYDFFIELIKSLDFVHVYKNQDSENSNEEIIESITQSFKELKQYKEGKIKGISARELLDDL